MGSNACSPISDQSLEIVENNNRGRSVVEGMKVIAIFALALIVVAMLVVAMSPANAWTTGILMALAFIVGTGFVLYFFRDAKPRPPSEPGAIVSPAHGTIDYIDTSTDAHFLNTPARRISIYLSLLNVHVQHAPISGSVEFLQHFPGRRSRAIRRDASLRNEHLLLGVTSGEGHRIAVRMISGIWVRRIVPWTSRGQQVVRGERIGLIRFGSRVDVFLPLPAQVSVKPGDKVRGGETILARLQE